MAREVDPTLVVHRDKAGPRVEPRVPFVAMNATNVRTLFRGGAWALLCAVASVGCGSATPSVQPPRGDVLERPAELRDKTDAVAPQAPDTVPAKWAGDAAYREKVRGDWLLVAPEDDRPWLETRTTEPCVFRGSLKVVARLYEAEHGGAKMIELDTVEVAALRPSATRDSRLHLKLEYPLILEGWVSPGTFPFELKSRVDIVPHHMWLEAGTPVSAARLGDSRAEVTRPFSPYGQPSGTPTVAEPVACGNLALAGSTRRPNVSPGTGGPVDTVPLVGPVPLYAEPNGRRVGQLQPAERVHATVLARRKGWLRVGGAGSGRAVPESAMPYIPSDFDAWIRVSDVPQNPNMGEFGGIGIRLPPREMAPEAATQAPIPVRLIPETSARVVARIATGVPQSSDGLVV